MKRDMDLIRELLLAIEKQDENPDGWIDFDQLGLSDYPLKMLSYHVMLLKQAGLVEAQDFADPNPDGFLWLPKTITWNGHEFLDTIRDPEIWRRTRESARRAGGFSLDIVKGLAKGFIRKKLEEHTGISLDF